jgi:uncharacterized phage protein gp47/JayE
MATNFLKYSSLTYDDIIRQINDKLASDSRFDNFREGSIAQTLVEIFAGTVDLINFYIERRAEECYFDTARLRSSVILLARSLGYDVQRAVPASAKIKMKIKGDLSTQITDPEETIQIPFHTVFTFEDQSYVLKQTLEIDVGQFVDDISTQGSDFDSGWIQVDLKGEDIWIAQGKIKEKIINGDTNPQVGSKFQLYRIDDTEFSNIYGTFDYSTPTTKIWVGNTKSDANSYTIDRRSLINFDTLENLQNGQTVDVCVVRTSQTEGVEVLFGDARYASLGAAVSAQGALTSFDNVYIQYLSTKGTAGNKTGLKDKKINFAGSIFTTLGGQNITDKIEFQFLTNPTGGGDMETIDEIKANAPNIYYSLDRLVSKRDYATYLKSLTNPINIKNAFAWGEQEEIQAQGIDAIQALFNIVFFTCVGSLYNINTSPYSVKSIGNGLDSALLDFNFDPNSVDDDSYFNVYTKNAIVRQLREYDISETRWQLFSNVESTTILKGLYDSGATTILVEFTSDDLDKVPSISGTTDITIDISTLKSTASSDLDFLNNLAIAVTNQLKSVSDNRGKPSNNSNLNSDAFPDVEMIFNSSSNQFELRHSKEDPCKIVTLSATLADTMGFSNEGVYVTGAYVVYSTTRELSQNILTVLNLLNERCQVTVNNIYVSPIIHNFELTGNVYLNALFDREKEKVEINNEIYKFLDTNADFNADIFVSNITEIIEKYPSVKYADIKLVPEIITGGPYFKTGPLDDFLASFIPQPIGYVYPTNSPGTAAIENYPWSNLINKILTYNIASSSFNNWNGTSYQYDTSGASDLLVQSTDGTTLQNYEFKWKKKQTTRNFFEVLAKDLFDSMKNSANDEIIAFADSTNFNDLLSAMWKDSVYMIRFNMLNTKGNISQERDNSNNVIKGGYTVGSEIVKVNITATYRYLN